MSHVDIIASRNSCSFHAENLLFYNFSKAFGWIPTPFCSRINCDTVHSRPGITRVCCPSHPESMASFALDFSLGAQQVRLTRPLQTDRCFVVSGRKTPWTHVKRTLYTSVQKLFVLGFHRSA